MEEITRLLSGLGEENAYAVRSSATAEDLPTASLARI
jgi:pyruvate,water dikinase